MVELNKLNLVTPPGEVLAQTINRSGSLNTYLDETDKEDVEKRYNRFVKNVSQDDCFYIPSCRSNGKEYYTFDDVFNHINVIKDLKRHRYYVDILSSCEKLSHAVRKKVGCVIVEPENRQIISDGYNGTPSGFNNNCEETKDGIEPNDTNDHLETKWYLSHAEENAFTKCLRGGQSTEGCWMYLTMTPCRNCSKLIANSGISKIFVCEIYRDPESLKFLMQYGVDISYINPKYLNEFYTVIEGKI